MELYYRYGYESHSNLRKRWSLRDGLVESAQFYAFSHQWILYRVVCQQESKIATECNLVRRDSQDTIRKQTDRQCLRVSLWTTSSCATSSKKSRS